MKPAVVAFLTCLLVLCVRGQSDNASETCKCKSDFIKSRIPSNLIKAGPFIYEPSTFCPRTEITILIKGTDKEKCVNPKSKAGLYFLSIYLKKKAAMSTTTASPQSNTSPPSTQSNTPPPSTQSNTPPPSTQSNIQSSSTLQTMTKLWESELRKSQRKNTVN